MYTLNCLNMNFCLYNSSLDFLKKYMDNVEKLKDQMRTDVYKMREEFGSPLEIEWASLDKKCLTENIDDVIKYKDDIDSRESKLWKDFVDNWFKKNGVPKWFEFFKEKSILVDIEERMTFEIRKVNELNTMDDFSDIEYYPELIEEYSI